MTIAIEQNQSAWLEFRILDSADDPVLLVESSQVRVFYKKFGSLVFIQKTFLVDVDDSSDPQEGENFVEIGFGVYAVNFSTTELDTAETFTWVVIPNDPGSLDFQYWIQQVDIVPNTDVTSTVSTINTTVTNIQSEVTAGFDSTTVDLTDIQSTLSTLTSKINAIQSTVDDIESAQPSSINVSFVG